MSRPFQPALLRRTVVLAAFALAALAGAAGISSCASDGTDAVRSAPSEERFREAMAAFNKEDYEEARKLFEAIVLQDPAGEYADDAQYYLGESYFKNGEYHLAAYAYSRLRSYPSSPFYKLSIFKTAESYYESAAPYDRDPKETLAAIDHFRSFISAYPGDSLANIAQTRVADLRTRLAQRDFSIAEQYMKLSDPVAALVYYDKVIADFPDTEYFVKAVAAKLQALCDLDRPADAKSFGDSLALNNSNAAAVASVREFQTRGCR